MFAVDMRLNTSTRITAFTCQQSTHAHTHTHTHHIPNTTGSICVCLFPNKYINNFHPFHTVVKRDAVYLNLTVNHGVNLSKISAYCLATLCQCNYKMHTKGRQDNIFPGANVRFDSTWDYNRQFHVLMHCSSPNQIFARPPPLYLYRLAQKSGTIFCTP